MKYENVNVLVDITKSMKTFLSNKQDMDQMIRDKNMSIARLNIYDDITKICVYEKGILKQEVCIGIGKNQVKIDKDNKISYISNDIRDLGRLYGFNLSIGDEINIDEIRGLCKILANVIKASINLNDYSWGFSKLIVGGKELLENDYRPNKIIITGFSSNEVLNQSDSEVFENGNIASLLYEEISNYNEVENKE